MSTPILHQFAISHFCEKARWALDYKGIEYAAHSMVPGMHSRKAKRLGSSSQLPILQWRDGQAIQGSTDIIDFLDEQMPERSLTPADPALAAEAREWERRIDESLGANVRRVCYDTLLDHKSLLVRLMGEDTAWYGKPFLSLIYPRLVPMMRKMLSIEPDAVETSKSQIVQMVGELEEQRGTSVFLVGDTFTRADVAAASMFAPLTLEPAYGMPWPDRMPEPLNGFSDSLRERLRWVDELYAECRPAS